MGPQVAVPSNIKVSFFCLHFMLLFAIILLLAQQQYTYQLDCVAAVAVIIELNDTRFVAAIRGLKSTVGL